MMYCPRGPSTAGGDFRGKQQTIRREAKDQTRNATRIDDVYIDAQCGESECNSQFKFGMARKSDMLFASPDYTLG